MKYLTVEVGFLSINDIDVIQCTYINITSCIYVCCLKETFETSSAKRAVSRI